MLNVFSSLGPMVNRVSFQLKKHSPEIMIIGGIACGVASTVLACIATTKAKPIVEEAKEELCNIKALGDSENDVKPVEYTEKDRQRDITRVYAKTAGKLALNYAPAIGAGAASVALILGGSKILNKRNAALAASAAASISEFKEYRDRVIKKFGKEIDEELRHGTTEVEIKETEVDENGKKKTVKSKIKVITDGGNEDGYKRIFDRHNPYWDYDKLYTETFFKARQSNFNDRLMANHYLFLNDVLEDLGFPKTKMGQEVGWIYDPSDDSLDNYVDLQIVPIRIPVTNSDGEVISYEPAYSLEFNVDGSILNRADWDRNALR